MPAAALLAFPRPPGPGLLAWIANRTVGQLVWVDRPLRLSHLQTVSSGFAAQLSPGSGGWTLESPSDGSRHVLAAGTPILISNTVLVPIEIRS